MKKKIIFIVGPTSVGKTKLGVDIAKEINGEIISCDSMQVYKEFNVGTAKVTEDEMQGVKHHLIDVITGDKNFNVSDYKYLAEEKISKIIEKGKIPIFVGGTGLYVNSIFYDYDFSKTSENKSLREEITKFYEEKGIDSLYEKMLSLDPELNKTIHKNNVKRVIRAIEICMDGNLKFSEQKVDKFKENEKYECLVLGLHLDREKLYSRINSRVDIMMENGLLLEVKYLLEKYGEKSQPFTAIGYKEFIPYFKGELSLDDSIDKLKQNSRRYAKRQYTWFNKNEQIKWIETDREYCDTFCESLNIINEFLKN